MIPLSFRISYAVVPKKGEDSFDLMTSEGGCAMCVADGCGGLGSRRYERLGGVTGAYLAARLVTRSFMTYAEDGAHCPKTREEARQLCKELESDLHGLLLRFDQKNRETSDTDRIVGSMQRALPTTLCAALVETGDPLCLSFLWAGDSRGYVLDQDGLHQLTRDHARGEPDALDSLYRDVPLTNVVSADQPAALSLRRLTINKPSVLLCVTDGVFGCLSTPMEFEMMLLSTMNAANDMAGWGRKLEIALNRLAHDDATVVCVAYGFESFADMSRKLSARRTALSQRYIAPVRKRGGELALAREKWNEYRATYDWTEGKDDATNWRI